LSIAIKNVITV